MARSLVLWLMMTSGLTDCAIDMLAGLGSDAGEGREAFPVVVLVAEKQLARLGPTEVQVRVMLPGEADAAVHLDGLGRDMEVRLGAVGLGERRRHRQRG